MVDSDSTSEGTLTPSPASILDGLTGAIDDDRGNEASFRLGGKPVTVRREFSEPLQGQECERRQEHSPPPSDRVSVRSRGLVSTFPAELAITSAGVMIGTRRRAASE